MTIKNLKAELVVQLRCDVGEGPVWDERDETLYFVDVSPGIVYHFNPSTSTLDSHSVGQEVGAAVPSDDGGLIVAARDGIYTMSKDGVVEPFLDVESDRPQIRMNDAKVDPAGRLWAGTMAFDFAAGVANLYRIEGSTVDLVIGDLTISNGLGWSPDGSVMYFIDSATYRVDMFDFDVKSGRVSNRRAFVQGAPETGMPDGLTVDAEGNVWVAHFGTGDVKAYAPDGTPVARVQLPVSQVTSCTFGGANYDTLYITTAAYELGEEDLAAQPLAGSVFSCVTGTRGLRPTPFGKRS